MKKKEEKTTCHRLSQDALALPGGTGNNPRGLLAKLPADLKHTSFHWAELFFLEGGREGGSERERVKEGRRPCHRKDQKKTNQTGARAGGHILREKGLPVLVHSGFYRQRASIRLYIHM